jgi:hypothetical protein
MSKKIEENIPIPEDSTPRVIKIRDYELDFLRDQDTVLRSFTHYHERLMTNYLKTIAIRLGFDKESNLEFEIDLKSDSRELSITPIDAPLPDEPPLH